MLWCSMEFYGVLSYVSVFFVVVVFLGPLQWHMEVPRLQVELKLQPPAYTRAIAMPDPSHVCDPHHSSGLFWEFYGVLWNFMVSYLMYHFEL